MARQRKPEPVKFCKHCEAPLERKRFGKRLEDYGVFLRRQYCSASCAAYKQHSVEAPLTTHARRTPPPTNGAGYRRSMKHVEDSCSACGDMSAKLVVHHIDGNPKNDGKTNFQTLCINCHNFWHRMHARIGRPVSVPMPRLIE